MRKQVLSGLTLLMLTTTSCINDVESPGSNRLGRYRLARINGGPLPGFVTQGSAARIDFLSGAVHLNTDFTFFDSTVVKVTPLFGGNPTINTDVAQGVYRLSNDTVFFSSIRNERYFMVYLSHESLLQELAGSLLLYTR
jgi:hypothetical protein